MSLLHPRSHSRPWRRCYPAAFSLVELLVTIAVLTVLIALALGAIGMVREQAATARCSSNIRQIYLLSKGWATDNRDWCPQAMWSMENIQKPYSNLRRLGFTDRLGKCDSSKDPSPNYGINAKLVTSSPEQWGPNYLHYYERGRYKLSLLGGARTILFAETAAQSWSLKKAGAYISARPYLNAPHRGKANVVYADGHVELLTPKELDPAAVWTAGIQ